MYNISTVTGQKISHHSAQAQMNSYYDLGPLTAVTTNMNQHVYFNILDDQVLPFSQRLHDEHALVAPIFQHDNRLEDIGLEEYVTGLMSTHTPHCISIGLQNHLT
ncbi:hypothetical protein AVEN_192402-1 [Araneus ventricosus]|uniref:Uncharacterized protein n=1 Tax=Araneus ventricosus TaxID=182803 RepID=A0A4Y2H724_ARAVE|nr:hypothetical protein AVEN_192402-1 [Araneus ventricosus]